MKQSQQYLLIVRTRPLPGREAEYHAWYDGTHLAEVLGLPGFVAARRFVPRAVPPAAETDGRFLAVFTIETDDPERTMLEFDEGRAKMPVPDFLDLDHISFELWEALGAEQRIAVDGVGAAEVDGVDGAAR
jgi:hypothetical protein